MLFDCHLDLAMNAVHWNRDLTKELADIRSRERGMNDKLDREKGVVCFPEMIQGDVRFCIATQIGHSVSQNSPLQGWNSPEIAWAQTQAQLAWYREMARSGHLIQIKTADELVGHKSKLESNDSIGFVLSLEGADSLIDCSYLEKAFDYGLRLIGPAHYGPGRYAAGTGESDGFTAIGFELLQEIERLGMILDITHLTDAGFDEAMESFGGKVIASHHNCRAMVEHQRQLTDEQIKRLIERDSVIGAAMDAWMLVPDWIRGKTTPTETGVSLEHVANNIDRVCQIAGNCHHSVIGSDLDGGFGFEQTPKEMDSIAKLTHLKPILESRGYSQNDIERILFDNAFRFMETSLPG